MAVANGPWKAARGAGSAKSPEENLSLEAEIFVVHDHVDEPTPAKWAAGLMVNRHIWKGRSIACPPLVGRDTKGEDEDPRGAYVALESRPRGEDGLGGGLPAEGDGDRRTSHQREWDFLQGHVDWAFAAYHGRHVDGRPPTELSPWQKIEALAQYAVQWKMRTADVYPSFHPVDVLLHSSYCTGAANVLHALAMVAGFDSRFIAVTNHSMVEIRVNGCWVWADNIWAGGAVTPTTHTYAEITENPWGIACLTDEQRALYGKRMARYRSPYHLGGRFYWHFCWGESKGRAVRRDVEDGYGLTVPYDPSTAAALYPESRRHAFFVPAGWPAAVNVSEPGGFVRACHELAPGGALRKRFYVGESPENPVAGGKVKLPVASLGAGGKVTCLVDGLELKAAGEGVRFKERTLDFDIPAAALTPGEHELVVCVTGSGLGVWLYPDPVQPYVPPVLGTELRMPDAAFSVRPVISTPELESLREAF